MSPSCCHSSQGCAAPCSRFNPNSTPVGGIGPGEVKHPPAHRRPCRLIFPPAPSQGLLGNLSLGSSYLSNWLIYPLAIDTAVQQGWPHSALPKSSSRGRAGPAFYTGTFETPGIAWDTFVEFPGWGKVRALLARRDEGEEGHSSVLFHLSGPAVDKWLQSGPVLAPTWAPADSLCAWLSAARWSPQQHHGAGAGRGTSHPSLALPRPACFQQDTQPQHRGHRINQAAVHHDRISLGWQ